MTMTTPEQRANMTAEDLRARASEMRHDWNDITKGGTRDSDEFRQREMQFLEEISDIDKHLTLHGLSARSYERSAPDGAMGSHESRSVVDEIENNQEFRTWATQQAGRARLTSESPAIEMRTLVKLATDAGELAPVGQPYLINQDRKRLFIRDLISVQQTGLSAVPYVREKNATTNSAAASTVAEAGLKPEAVVEFTPDLAPVTVIAVNIPITTQVLEDVPTVVGYIRGRLSYMLQVREEQQILSGNGTNQDLKGIYNYSDIQTQGATSGDAAVTIGNAIAKIEAVNGYADGVAMRPAAAWTMFMHRASTSGVLDAGTPFSDIPLNVWGLPVVRTVDGVTSGHALVGNFRLGATLFDRRQASVRVYEQHSDFVVYNKVLLQGEERVALAVNRPDWFVDATL